MDTGLKNMTEIKVEKGGRIFKTKKESKVSIKKLDDTTYELEIKNSVKVVSVRIPHTLYEKANTYAKIHKTTISEIIREALKKYLEHTE